MQNSRWRRGSQRHGSGHRISLFLLVVMLTGCASVGPGTIPRDQFAYGSAISDSWKQQTLLNLLRIRYGEVPVFLEVSSVINQYTFDSYFEAGGSFIPRQIWDSASVKGSGRWTDRPTITYSPLTGEKLAERLMRPIEPASVLALVQAGWPVEFVLPLTVRSVNGLRGISGTRVRRGPGDEGFFRLVELLKKAQRSSHIGVRLERSESGQATIIMLTQANRAHGEEAGFLTEIRSLLGLDPTADSYALVFGAGAKSDRELAMHTKSGLEVMVDLCTWIDVPEEHVKSGRTPATRTETAIGKYRVARQFQVHHGDSVPPEAHVAVPFRDTWFWIDDRDMESKRALAFLMLLFSLAESGSGQVAPVITVGAGG